MNDQPAMNPQPDPEPNRLNDPVASYFAQQRAEVHDLPTDDLRWQRITTAATSGQRRSSWGRGLVAAAAAAALAGTMVWVAGRPPSGHTPAASGSGQVASSNSATGDKGMPTDPVDPPATSAPGPTDGPFTLAGFTVGSLSNSGSGRVWALGQGACSEDGCTGLAASSDNGVTWRPVGVVPAPLTAATASDLRSNSYAVTVSDVRFADASTGWAFGGALLRTNDGGKNWQPMAHEGDVIAVETNGKDVVVVTRVGDKAKVWRVAASATELTSADLIGELTRPASVAAPANVVSAQIAWTLSSTGEWSAVVSAAFDGKAPAPLAASSAGVYNSPLPGGCADGFAAIAAASAGDRALGGVCRKPIPAGASDGTSNDPVVYTSWQSMDAGRTWTQAPAASGGLDPALILDPGDVTLAAAGKGRLVAVSTSRVAPALPAATDSPAATTSPASSASNLRTAIMVTRDSGTAWTNAAWSDSSALGARWVGSPGADEFYVISGQPDMAYYRSTDGGNTWTPVRVGR